MDKELELKKLTKLYWDIAGEKNAALEELKEAEGPYFAARGEIDGIDTRVKQVRARMEELRRG